MLLYGLAVLLTTVLGTRATEGKSNHTVTAEAWFDIEILDYDGPGDDYRGRFVIALFGKTVPMTVMNFASIAKGFERKREHGVRVRNTVNSIHDWFMISFAVLIQIS